MKLQEVRWNGKGRIDKKEFSILYRRLEKITGQAGTIFVFNGKIYNSLKL